MITAHSLTKRYGATTAVDNLTFEVPPGVVTGFLGPNGSGKSTTMRMIMGLDIPDSGSALIGGKRYPSWPGLSGRSAPCSTRRRSTRLAPPATTCGGWP
jgi:ABC-2 type transport system ATP-binding protein